jgi:hypothetical protein
MWSRIVSGRSVVEGKVQMVSSIAVQLLLRGTICPVERDADADAALAVFLAAADDDNGVDDDTGEGVVGGADCGDAGTGRPGLGAEPAQTFCGIECLLSWSGKDRWGEQGQRIGAMKRWRRRGCGEVL